MKIYFEGVPYIIGAVILSLLTYIINSTIGALFIYTTFFIVLNFRLLKRILPNLKNDAIISPCDGIVIGIYSEIINKKEFTKVVIAKSILNNAIIRMPYSGKIIEKTNSISYKNPNIEDLKNKSLHSALTLKIKGKSLIYLVQIPDMFIKKIINNANENMSFKAGQAIGCSFKSKIQLIFPKNFEVNIKLGQTVVASETIIGMC